MNNFSLKGYEVEKEIGKGSFSKVFKVKDRKEGNWFAAKKLVDECWSLNDDACFPEVKLIKTVPSHPNLLSIVDFVHVNGCLTIITDLMDRSLHDFIEARNRPLSESRSQRMLLQIVRGLEHLHRNGVFHRDIKPENILLKNTGVYGKEIVQLADFGTIARIDDRPPFTPYIATRWYRSPECLLTMGYYGPKMDIWAVGCCFYEMLARRALFPGENERHMILLIHELLGSPSKSALEKFRHLKLGNVSFPKRFPADFRVHLPLLSARGIDVLKKTIVYHPENRISASKLLNHMYFDDLTKRKKLCKFSQSTQSLNPRLSQTDSQSKGPTTKDKANCRYRGTSILSGNSSMTANSAKCLLVEDQIKKKRALERMWAMHDGPEKQNLSRQIRRSWAT